VFPKIFRTIYKYAQTFGKENILSALLASMFEFSPKILPYILESLGLNITAGHKRLLDSNVFQIETGVTYFCNESFSSENFSFRPDIVTYAGNSFDSRKIHDFIVFESKIDSQITTRQLTGYPFLRKKYGISALLILISNSVVNDVLDCFGCQIGPTIKQAPTDN